MKMNFSNIIKPFQGKIEVSRATYSLRLLHFTHTKNMNQRLIRSNLNSFDFFLQRSAYRESPTSEYQYINLFYKLSSTVPIIIFDRATEISSQLNR